VVLEGVGGLLTPLGAHTTVLDFLRRAGGPAVLVARAGLGTVNHTLLSLRELFRAGAPLAGVVLNVTRREDAANVLPSRREIERLSGVRVSVVLPFLPAARGGAGARELRAARLLRPVAERWLRQGAR
jgi:dethiobiotin synthetase